MCRDYDCDYSDVDHFLNFAKVYLQRLYERFSQMIYWRSFAPFVHADK
jgi:hypothetical protein